MSGAAQSPEGDDLLAEQVDYYRRRAREYDVTAYPDPDAARARITRVVAALRPAGNVLEIAASRAAASRLLRALSCPGP